ncbi:MAG: MBL fold metallo-hydrolase [Verrucomicrobiota bacterium]|nr:MBL fold metallo-hydrolase [Verrucomicrobiota bacterium]
MKTLGPIPPLEDTPSDILGKASRGLGLTGAEACRLAGLETTCWNQALNGELPDPMLVKLAATLGLGGERLVAIRRGAWKPALSKVSGLVQSVTRDDDMLVNSYLVVDDVNRKAILFDTGMDAIPVITELNARGIQLVALFLTHTHSDHVAAMAQCRAAFPKLQVWCPAAEKLYGTAPFGREAAWQVGSLGISAHATPGHSPGGTTYVVYGLSKLVAITGDAIFAASAGGAPTAWKSALTAVRKQILSLPGDTVLCPGHGPVTTVDEERENNPFFP